MAATRADAPFPSLYLFVRQLPRASRTARLAKFSDAMSSSPRRCRTSSREMDVASSGSNWGSERISPWRKKSLDGSALRGAGSPQRWVRRQGGRGRVEERPSFLEVETCCSIDRARVVPLCQISLKMHSRLKVESTLSRLKSRIKFWFSELVMRKK